MNRLFVRAPAGNGYSSPAAMKRVDYHLTGIAAAFVAPDGLPYEDADGIYEVRVYDDRLSR